MHCFSPNRFGSIASWTTGYTWRFIFFCSLVYAMSQIPDADVYFWSANLGEIVLLIGAVHLLMIVIVDLKQSAQFSDFLRCSNAAFRIAERKSAGGERKHASPMRAPVHMAVNSASVRIAAEGSMDRQHSTATPHSMVSYNSTNDGLELIEVEESTKEELFPTYDEVYGLDGTADAIPISPQNSDDKCEPHHRIISRELSASTRMFTAVAAANSSTRSAAYVASDAV